MELRGAFDVQVHVQVDMQDVQVHVQPSFSLKLALGDTIASVLSMANTRFYLDVRGAKPDTSRVLKIAVAHKGQSVLISLTVRLQPNQWDKKKQRVVNHNDQMLLNVYISNVKQKVDTILLSLANEGLLGSLQPAELKAQIEEHLNPEKAQAKEEEKRKSKLFSTRFKMFADRKRAGTKRLYMETYKRMSEYAGAKLEQLTFEDITKEWLLGFDSYLEPQSPSRNARNIHLRNIRAVFNDALDDEITIFYPFRRFSIRNTATRKRNIKVEDLRTFFNCPCDKKAQKHLDMFKLIFMLIGINLVDLCHLKEIDNEGRINYYRAKTKRLYSVKVEPEALEIINKYRGENWLVDILDRYKDYKDYTKRINQALKLIGPYKREGRGGKKTVEPLFPEISTYWARHSWATIAASLDIPKETIAAALGHGGNTVTDIYIEFDQRKVDEANRKVLDWVLYGKR